MIDPTAWANAERWYRIENDVRAALNGDRHAVERIQAQLGIIPVSQRGEP